MSIANSHGIDSITKFVVFGVFDFKILDGIGISQVNVSCQF